MTFRRPGRGTAVLVATLLLGAGVACSADSDDPGGPGAADPSTPSAPGTGDVAVPGSGGEPVAPDDPRLDVALSEPQEDRNYPEVGDPGVDALHYQLDLSWTPDTRTLDAVETLVFRATADAEEFQLDLGEPLTVSSLTLDGEEVEFREDGKDLVVASPVTADQRYTLELAYGGTPQPVAAPTTRTDISTLGWTVTGSGETWTMQEPFGAYSYYAVNDHPSDKALYDFTLSTPAPWTGVANGTLESREVVDGDTVTRWHLDEPAASYLVTVAMGDFASSRARADSGVPMTFWTPRGDAAAARRARSARHELDWIEDKLGPYPFSSLGVLVVDSRRGMETLTMITLGNYHYTLSTPVLVHEMVHQWYGDQVTPRDWRDLWLNEGMTMYLQAVWESERHQTSLDGTMAGWAASDQEIRDEAGPPAAYDPSTFGEGNVYYLPALMWHQLRGRLGDDTFWRLVRAWPAAHDNGHADYDEVVAWWSEQSGADLRPLFDSWLLSEDTPPWR